MSNQLPLPKFNLSARSYEYALGICQTVLKYNRMSDASFVGILWMPDNDTWQVHYVYPPLASNIQIHLVIDQHKFSFPHVLIRTAIALTYVGDAAAVTALEVPPDSYWVQSRN